MSDKIDALLRTKRMTPALAREITEQAAAIADWLKAGQALQGRLGDMRRALDITQSDLAKLAKATQAQVSYVEGPALATMATEAALLSAKAYAWLERNARPTEEDHNEA